METNPATLGVLPMGEPVLVTPELRLQDLDRCDMRVWCQGSCRQGRRILVSALIARFGLEARLVDLAPKFRCTRCGGLGHMDITRLMGVHRPCGTEPFYS